MSGEDRDLSGILFRNNRKQQPNHADYNGSCRIDGVDYWMNAWLKEGKNGRFMSFSFRRKEQSGQSRQSDSDRDEEHFF